MYIQTDKPREVDADCVSFKNTNDRLIKKQLRNNGEIFGIGNIKDLQKLRRKKNTRHISRQSVIYDENSRRCFSHNNPFFCLKCLYSDDRAVWPVIRLLMVII